MGLHHRGGVVLRDAELRLYVKNEQRWRGRPGHLPGRRNSAQEGHGQTPKNPGARELGATISQAIPGPYADFATSGLTFHIKSGSNSYDIDLK
jgi:hypothetical protein